MFKKIKNRKGFTLIELIVVIAILAVLAAIIIPTVSSNIARANEARDLANARSVYAQVAIDVISNPPGAGSYAATGEPTGVECRYSVAAGGNITGFECETPTGFHNLVGGQVVKATITAFTITP
jgi:prepilin-type N-terminal cleavage/methylation domain-containing protein